MNLIKSLNWILTDQCNSACLHCDIWKLRPPRTTNLNEAIRVLDDPLIRNSYEHYRSDFDIALGGGEPFLIGHIQDIVDHIHARYPGALKTISTNGLLTQAALAFALKNRFRNIKLNVSVDGLGVVHDRIRGKKGAFQKTLKTIIAIKRRIPTQKIELKLTLLPQNSDQPLKVYQLAGRLGCEFSFKPAEDLRSYTNRTAALPLDFTREQLCLIRRQAFRIADDTLKQGDMAKARFFRDIPFYLFGTKQPESCSVLKTGITLLADGRLYSCLKNPALGNIHSGRMTDLKQNAPRPPRTCPSCMLKCGAFKDYGNKRPALKTANVETTYRCNLNCDMCTQKPLRQTAPDMSLNQFEALLDHHPEIGHISFVGGEPFLNKDFFKMLDCCDKRACTYEITTNGTLVTDAVIKKLAAYAGIKKINFSLDGTRRGHDRIRGRGAFRKCLAALKKCHRLFSVGVSSVLRHDNLCDIMDLARLLRHYAIAEHKIIASMRISRGQIRQTKRSTPELDVSGTVFPGSQKYNYFALEHFVKGFEAVSPRTQWEPSALRYGPTFFARMTSFPARCRQSQQYRFNSKGERIVCEFFRNRYDRQLVRRIRRHRLPICQNCCKNEVMPDSWLCGLLRAHYGINPQRVFIREITQHVTGQQNIDQITYLIRADQEEFLLKQRAAKKKDFRVFNDYNVIHDFLEKEGFKLNQNIPTKTKEPYLRLGPHCYQLVGFRDAVPLSENNKNIYLAGMFLGRYHNAMRRLRQMHRVRKKTPRLLLALFAAVPQDLKQSARLLRKQAFQAARRIIRNAAYNDDEFLIIQKDCAMRHFLRTGNNILVCDYCYLECQHFCYDLAQLWVDVLWRKLHRDANIGFKDQIPEKTVVLIMRGYNKTSGHKISRSDLLVFFGLALIVAYKTFIKNMVGKMEGGLDDCVDERVFQKLVKTLLELTRAAGTNDRLNKMRENHRRLKPVVEMNDMEP